MRPLTEEEVRAFVVRADDRPDELRLVTLPADFLLTDWDHLDFLAWRDPRTRGRGYVITEVDGEPAGIVLRGCRRARRTRVPALCNLCHTMQPADQVVAVHGAQGG